MEGNANPAAARPGVRPCRYRPPRPRNAELRSNAQIPGFAPLSRTGLRTLPRSLPPRCQVVGVPLKRIAPRRVGDGGEAAGYEIAGAGRRIVHQRGCAAGKFHSRRVVDEACSLPAKRARRASRACSKFSSPRMARAVIGRMSSAMPACAPCRPAIRGDDGAVHVGDQQPFPVPGHEMFASMRCASPAARRADLPPASTAVASGRSIACPGSRVRADVMSASMPAAFRMPRAASAVTPACVELENTAVWCNVSRPFRR